MKKHIMTNRQTSFEQNNNDITETKGILEKATLKFFPEEGAWSSYCFRKSEGLSKANLPCHLRDDLWLAKMLKQDQNLFFISTNKVLKFVKTSPIFLEKRHEYEQKIVKWQISWMRSGGENWIIDEDYGGYFVLLSPVCDLGFRKGVVDTLSSIGMNLDAIEEGLEKNANMWRNELMCSAFENEYESVFLSLDFTNYSLDEKQTKQEKKTLEPINSEFKEKWLKMRKYEYYQRHKNSVDKYGVVEPDMKLSDQEVTELKDFLEKKHNERMAQIEQFKKDKTKGRAMTIKKQ